MIYKSYLVEKNIEILKNKVVLFYGENQGMQDNFKSTIKNKNVEVEIIRYNQDEVTNDVNSFFEKIFAAPSMVCALSSRTNLAFENM